MKTLQLLMVEDDAERVTCLRDWLPSDMRIVWARSAGAALGVLRRDRRGTYAGLMLDHDLQSQARTDADKRMDGRDVVAVIIEQLDRNALVLVHSMNYVSAPEMVSKLDAAGFSVERIPYAVLTAERFRAWCDEVRAQWDET